MKKGTALQIMDIADPKPFDIYYFVESNEDYKAALEKNIKESYPGRKANVVKGDCNVKLRDLVKFLKSNLSYRALVFIDPYGMEIQWSSIEALKGVGVDVWILVATGVGANRLLKGNGEISEAWYNALETFLGLPQAEIDKRFYKRSIVQTLFGDETSVTKQKQSVEKLGDLYAARLGEIFKYVSKPFIMKNSVNAIMYHFMMATNNANGVKIANDVIKPKYEE